MNYFSGIRYFAHSCILKAIIIEKKCFKNMYYIAESWSAAWRDREVKTILAGSPGVEGWEAVYRRSPATWPQLASDLNNVAIVRKQQRRGRH